MKELHNTNFTVSENKLQNIEWLRVFAVFSLVFWHSICVYTGWQKHLPEITEFIGESIYTEIYLFFSRIFLPDANMPLFTAISGYVYCYLRNYKGKYESTADFVKNKAKRLMVPFFIIGIIVVFTIFDWDPFRLVYGDAHHLWFCAMLFWCFIGIRLYESCSRWLKFVIVFLCVLTNFKTFSIDFIYLYRSLRFFPYFLLGYYLVYYLPLLQSKLKYKILVFVVSLIFVFLLFFVSQKYLDTIIRIAYNIFFTLSLFVIVPINIRKSEFVTKISTYSFGIYVFHEWFLWNMAHLKSLETIIINYQILYPFIVYVLIFSLSTILTHYCLKTQAGKFLLS